MKKLSMLFILILVAINIHYVVKADLIDGFEEINLENPKAKMLHQYSKKELTSYYPQVSKRMMLGWRVHQITKSEKVTFKKTTLMSIRNSGTTPIIKDHSMKKEKSQKYAISASDGVEASASGTYSGFKLGLSKKLNIKADATISISQTESMNTKIQVDPGTQLDIYVMGSGRLSNGVASYYMFWLRMKTGGYEYLNITSIYYRMEKKKI